MELFSPKLNAYLQTLSGPLLALKIISWIMPTLPTANIKSKGSHKAMYINRVAIRQVAGLRESDY